jgi:hypothetical protein
MRRDVEDKRAIALCQLTQNALFEEVQQNYRSEIQWGNRRLPCATPQGLVILKFYALPSLYGQGKFDRAALYETDILQPTYRYNLSIACAQLSAHGGRLES